VTNGRIETQAPSESRYASVFPARAAANRDGVWVAVSSWSEDGDAFIIRWIVVSESWNLRFVNEHSCCSSSSSILFQNTKVLKRLPKVVYVRVRPELNRSIVFPAQSTVHTNDYPFQTVGVQFSSVDIPIWLPPTLSTCDGQICDRVFRPEFQAILKRISSVCSAVRRVVFNRRSSLIWRLSCESVGKKRRLFSVVMWRVDGFSWH
jgi:hypothetical protein